VSAGANAAALARMDEPDKDGSLRELAERLALAAVGAVALTGERADSLADALAARGAIRRDEARELIDDFVARWRGEATRVGERAGGTLAALFRELGLVTREEYEELELRVAQLEHRLRLVEGTPPKPQARV
jgi:polyhydroxyalkanoate synthesis regulator phasin